ncbi:MAG: hypothetical protein IKS49_06865 [Actinomycetaceae bacterium]|nr:hypothetical protein [Actinomycetaceae bacterium]
MTEKNTVQMTKKETEGELGMVSAETALGALALALVFILMLSVIGASVLYIHAQDLSRSAARSLSLGHSPEEVSQAVSKADSRATMQVTTEADYIAVTVSLDPPAPVKNLGLAISATTVAPFEPGAAP